MSPRSAAILPRPNASEGRPTRIDAGEGVRREKTPRRPGRADAQGHKATSPRMGGKHVPGCCMRFMHEPSIRCPPITPPSPPRASHSATRSSRNGGRRITKWEGSLEAADAEGFEAIPILMAWATPSGPVTAEVFDEITQALIDRVRREQPDGLLLALHGAMVAESHPDADGEVLARLRQALGSTFPIVVTLDLHGNLSERLVNACTAAVAYRTNPHVDQRECGRRAARLMVRTLRREVRPCVALAKPPLIVNIMVQDTSQEPLRAFMQEARAWRSIPASWP